MHIGMIMIFGGILELVWPINNQKKYLLYNFRRQSKSGIQVVQYSIQAIYLRLGPLCYE